jgi:hypothetical protein
MSIQRFHRNLKRMRHVKSLNESIQLPTFPRGWGGISA